ncbi:MAG TPA: PRC-barrel domain-containing protein [Allosphingosinicella sp.]|nr:PRC-barrel domain-containing protein [Allosphingosinicella sp.]
MAVEQRIEEPLDEVPLDPERVSDASHELISSRRVEGTPVYNRQNEKLGTIHSVMIDKRSGRIAYALMWFGGFLGIGGYVHPVPWDMLDYDVRRDGYVVDLPREKLNGAPTFRLDEAERPRERSEEDLAFAYYGQMPWWGGGAF